MKKFLLILLTTAATLSISGCQKDNSQKTEEAELDAVSSSLSGTLLKYTGTEISIETSEGEKLSFHNCEKAQLDLENGIVPGNEVTLMYVGSIEDTNTSKVKVRKIITGEDNSSVLALSKKAQETLPNNSGSPVILEEDHTDKETKDAQNDSKKDKTNEKAPQKEKNNNEDFATGDSKEATIVGGVYVRSAPQSGSEILGTLQDGDAVTITNTDGSGWYQITFEGQTGYIWKDFVN